MTSLLQARVVVAQRPACGAQGYNQERAARNVYSYLVKGNHFTYFTAGPYHQAVFPTKVALRKTSQLKIIPVLAVTHLERLVDTASAAGLETLFPPSYCHFAALLLRDRVPVALIVSFPQQQQKHARLSRFGVHRTVALNHVADTFYAPGVCLFYDVTLRTYAYVNKGAYVFWNEELKQFSEVQGVAGYRQLYRRGVPR
ncbi:hypothetical protein [Hymenobacter antarcticus]|uniref:hypothetical protein n=1 Tax=Hymenobacter antarcticus TaxID=486270 RepID=UPI0031E72850